MIKATIQNSPYCTEIRFPCSETELSRKLKELRMYPKHLAPIATVLEIEPEELSMLTDCDVPLDALNFLGKRMDGMSKGEREQFLAVLSCGETGIGSSLKNIINLTYNLERFTLIEDTDDVERVGRTHILNVRGYLSESESNNHNWLAEEGVKLLESGSGIETDYGKIYINNDVPFKEVFNGTTLPAYYCEMNSVAGVEIGYGNLTEFVELPCEDITIKKALCRLGADDLKDCRIMVDSTRDIPEEWEKKISEVEKTKDLFGLNKLLKTADMTVKPEQPESIFKKEIEQKLCGEGYTVADDGDWLTVMLNGAPVAKINDKDILYTNEDFYDKDRAGVYPLSRVVREIYDYCSAYEKAPPLTADGLSKKYRCLAEFGDTVLCARCDDCLGFEFVTWFRSSDGRSVCNGNYFSDYISAKENFAVRSCLIDENKLFNNTELVRLNRCVEFTINNNGDLGFDDCEFLQKLNRKISENLPEQQSDPEPKLSM